MKKILTALFILTFTLGGITLFAQQGPGKKMHGKKMHQMQMPGMGMHLWMQDKLLETIGVDEKTRTAIRGMMIAFEKDMLDLHYHFTEERLALQKEMLKPNFDETKVKNIIKKMGELRKDQLVKAEFRKLDMLKMLSLEQRKQLYEQITIARTSFMQKMSGPHSGRGPGNQGGHYQPVNFDE